VLLGLVLTVGPGTVAMAGDDDDVPIYQKAINGIMTPFTWINRAPPSGPIEYRERSPLVLPPSTDLPPPQAGTADPPAWPKGPQTPPKKRAERQKKEPPAAPAAAPTAVAATSPGAAAAGATQQPEPANDIGGPFAHLEGNLIDGLKGSLTNAPEAAPFTGEPPRTSLVEPPPGYQTPSPAYPYGVYGTSNKPIPTLIGPVGGDAPK